MLKASWKTGFALALAVCCVAFVGCKPSDGLVPIKGTVTLDGEPIVETNGRRLYIKVLSPNMYDFVGEEQKPGEIKYSLKITYQTGEEFTLDLARLNERQYAAILNGKDTGFYVNVNDLHDLEKAVLKVKDGHTLGLSE